MNIFSTCLELKTVNYQAFHNTCMWGKKPIVQIIRTHCKITETIFLRCISIGIALTSLTSYSQ